MARRGFGGNALRAALGAVTGVAEGMRLREEREFEREKEKAAAARQAMYDALALADRGALPTAQSRALGQRAAGETVKAFSGAINALQGGAATPFDESAIAQGAGRMGEPAAKFTVGGVEYALPDQEQRRRALEAQSLATELAKREKISRIDEEGKIRTEQRGAQRLRDLVGRVQKSRDPRSEAALELAIESPTAYRAIFPEPERPSALDALRADEAARERQAQEAQGMAFLDANRRNPAVTNAYASVFANNPKMSPGMVGYSIMQQELAGALAAQREASAGASAARTDVTKAKAAGRAPSALPPGAGTVGTPSVPVRDELDMAYDRYTTPKR